MKLSDFLGCETGHMLVSFVFAVLGIVVAVTVDKATGLTITTGAVGWAARSMGSGAKN